MFQSSYGIITDPGELRDYVDRILADGRAFSWDWETGYHGESREKASLHAEENFPAGISLTNSLKWSRYVPLAHDTGPNMDQRKAAEILYPLLAEARGANGQPLGVAHGGKFELRVGRVWFREQLGAELDYRQFRLLSDTMLESYAEAVNRFHGLKELSELQAEADRSGFWHKQLELEDLYPEKLTAKARKCIRFNVLNPLDPRVQQYVCDDTVYALAHHRMRYPRLQRALAESPHRGPGFIWKLEMAVLPVVCEMEDEGVWYDWIAMRDWAARGKEFAARYMDEIRADFGELRGAPLEPTFNFGSPIQLRRLLYQDCGMPVQHWTKGGKSGNKQPGTDAKVALKSLSAEYPQVAKYLQWKRLVKLYRDFLEAFESKYCFAEDRRAHPSWIQHGVPAGRFANSDPNVQQCLPGDYSVLTPQGWCRLDELKDDENVAQYWPDGRVSFGVPQEVVRNPHDGPMAGICSLEGGDWKYTLNHRLIYRKRRRKRVGGRLQDAADSEVMEMTAAQWGAALQVRPAMFPDGRSMLNDVKEIRAGHKETGHSLTGRDVWVMRLAVACQAEGNRRADGRGGSVWYDVELRGERKQQQFAEIAAALGLEFRQTSRGRRCRVPGELLGLWLDEGKNFVPYEVLRLSAQWLREFVAEVMRWDGSFTTGAEYKQKDVRRASVEVVQAAAALCGYATHLRDQHVDGETYPVLCLDDKETKFSGAQWSYPAWLRGMVYCVTVPSGMFIVRNPEGYVQVTGNSPKKYRYELRDGTEFHFNFRDMVGAPPGWYQIGFDLAQAELRAVAGMAGEQKMFDAFLHDVDVHSVTASLLFGVPVDQVTPEQRDVGKTMGLALVYGLTEQGLADRLGITVQQAEDLFAAFHAAYPRIKAWTEKTIRGAQETGYVETWWGRKVRIWDIDSPDRRKREDAKRTAGNAPVQGCLPADTRVLTRRGWVPVIEFQDGEEVWTGAEWACAVRLPKGVAPRLRVHLSDGRTFDCDNRHKLLVTDAGPWPQWCPVTAVKGRVLARDGEQEWGEPDSRSVEDWYWIGRFTGDGCLWKSNGRAQWKMAFHRGLEDTDIARFKRWLSYKPWRTVHSPRGYHENGRGEGWSVVGRTAPAAEWWLSVGGFRTGRHGVQEVPPEVFRLDRVRREAFLRGRIDADGYRRGFRADHGRELRECSKVGTVSLSAAKDLCRLAATVGMTGRVCGPYVMHRRGAGGTEHCIYELYFHKEPAPLVVTEVEDLGITERMYTLSVHHLRHAFSSEGLISKNSATGDYMKLVMVRCEAALRKAGLKDRVRLVMNVHDALEYYAHKSVKPAEVVRVLQPAVVFPVSGWPPLKAEWHCGERWGSVRKLDVTLNADGSVARVRLKTDVREEPDIDLGDEDEEDVAPARPVPAAGAVLQAARPAAGRVREDPVPVSRPESGGSTPRTVVVTALHPFPQELAAQLVGYFRDRPGPNTVKLKLADGQVLEFRERTCGVTPADEPEISVIVGGATVRYDEASVDMDAIGAGVIA